MDLCLINKGRRVSEVQYNFHQLLINDSADWIRDSGEPPRWANKFATLSEYSDLDTAAVEAGSFDVVSAPSDTLELTVEPGEAALAANLCITDAQKVASNLPPNEQNIGIYLGWNVDDGSGGDISVGEASAFGDNWYTLLIHEVDTDDTGIVSTTDRRPVGQENARRRDGLSVSEFNETVYLNNGAVVGGQIEGQGREFSQVKLWQWSGVPGWQPPRQLWVNTNAQSGKDEVQGFFRDRNGSLERYRIPLQQVVPTIEDWESGSPGARWTLDDQHNIVSPGLNGSNHRLQVGGFGESNSTASLPNKPSPGEWIRIYWQFESYHNSADVSSAVFEFGGTPPNNTYQIFWAHREGQNELVSLRKMKDGTNEHSVLSFENVNYFQLNTEYYFDIYWPEDSSENWEMEVCEADGTVRDTPQYRTNDYEHGSGDIRINNPGGYEGVTWSVDEITKPARQKP